MTTATAKKKTGRAIPPSKGNNYVDLYGRGSDNLGAYLKEIGRYDLLTSEQEISYGRLVQKWMSIKAIAENFKEKHGKEPTNQRLADLASIPIDELNQIVEQGKRARAKMVEANLRLVVSIAKKYQNRGMDMLEMIQNGSIGLMRGIEKYNPERGYKVSTYCYWWIRQAITRAIAGDARIIRLPIHIAEKLNRFKNVRRQLSQELGRQPRLAEIADVLEMEPAALESLLDQTQKVSSLNRLIGKEQDTERGDLIECDLPQPDEFIETQELKLVANQLLGYLTPQQAAVMRLRYGIHDGKAWTLEEIGAALGFSRERARQVLSQGFTKLRRKQMADLARGVL